MLKEAIEHLKKQQADTAECVEMAEKEFERRMEWNKEFAGKVKNIGGEGIPGFNPDDPAL